MWIFNNYLNLKQAYKKKSIIDNLIEQNLNNNMSMNDDEIVVLQTEESKRRIKLELEGREQETLKLIQKCELEYDRTLYTILFSLQQRQEPKDFLFSKIICQVPLLTDNCLKLLKTFCQDERRFYFSMSTLCDLITTRFAQRQTLLNMLLEFTHNQNATLRENAIGIALKLNEREEFRPYIEVLLF